MLTENLFTPTLCSSRPARSARPRLPAFLAAALLVLSAPLALAEDVAVPPEIQAIVDNPQRSDADRETDKRRHPAELLAFFGVRPGMSVLDIGTGRGYTAELLARAVGPKGSVVGQNDPMIFEKFMKGKPDARFSTDIMKNVQHVVRPYDDPVPPGAGPFDLITVVFVYHDTEWMGRDRQAMNKKFFNALKPGGHIVVVDHAGNPGTGATQTQTLAPHRGKRGARRPRSRGLHAGGRSAVPAPSGRSARQGVSRGDRAGRSVRAEVRAALTLRLRLDKTKKRKTP